MVPFKLYLGAPAWWANFGAGWPGTNGTIPALTAANDPAIGQNLTVTLGNSRGASTPALLFTGFAPANVTRTCCCSRSTSRLSKPTRARPRACRSRRG